MEKVIRVGIGVIVQDDKGRVLLGKRNKAAKRGAIKLRDDWDWTLPGGGLEYGEEFEEGAIREVKEETDLDIKEPKQICTYNDRDDLAHWITIGMRATNWSGKLKTGEPHKHSEWRWFELDKLPDNIFFPSAKILEALKKEQRPKIITICGSLRFQDKQMEVAERLELEGNAVIPVIYPVPGFDKDAYTEEQGAMLDKMHKVKIDLSDAIYVVNVNGYVGNSTKSEIEYAKQTGKEIMYLEKPKQ